ncbi:glycoside hydrolase [Suillus weaverae]|nr:glycoside hydrolase [Suillus weaverae]
MYLHCAIQIPMESNHLHFKLQLLFETAVSQLIHYPEYNSTLILRSEISLQRYILLSDSSLPTSPRPQIQPLHNRHCALKRYIPLKPSSKVCAVSSRYYKEKSEIYPVAMHFAKHSAANALINGWKSVELCQAYILMSIYTVPARRWEEDRSWVYTGRTCGAVSTTQPQTEREMLNRARFGKPSTIKEDYITRYSADWYKQSRFRDKRFVCERLVPTAFVALPSPQFNTKDGRMMIAQHDRYGDWLNKDEIVQDYVRYAKVCFQAFGNQVKHWLTVNEPWCISILGYGRGVFAPGRSSDRGRSPKATPPPNRGFKLYREEFKAVQGGQIGITLNGDWAMPYNDSPQNVEAVQHTLDVAIGWFAVLRERLLEFTPEELKVVKESSDFYGMNTYTINLCRDGGDDEFQGLGPALHHDEGLDCAALSVDGTVLATGGKKNVFAWDTQAITGLEDISIISSVAASEESSTDADHMQGSIQLEDAHPLLQGYIIDDTSDIKCIFAFKLVRAEHVNKDEESHLLPVEVL